MITLEMKWNGGQSEKKVNPTESDVFKAIGEQLLNIKSVPNELHASCTYGDAYFHIIERGSYVENGIIYPSMFVDRHENNMSGLEPSLYSEKKLHCIHPESNNYKFYKFIPINSGNQTVEVTAEYGRLKDGADGTSFGNFWEMGTRRLKNPFPSYMFWVRYFEKISKGYKDFTDILLNDTEEPDVLTEETVEPEKKKRGRPKKKKEPTQASIRLYNLLMKAAEQTVANTLSEGTKITRKQIEAVSDLIGQLGTCDTVESFNSVLRDILMLSPRKARNIAQFFATSKDDFDEIIDNETKLLNSMKMVYMKGTKAYQQSKEIHSFDEFGVEVYDAKDWQMRHVMKKIPDAYHKYLNKDIDENVGIYRVIPGAQKKIFDKFVKAENITDCKEVFHASATENFGGEDGIIVKSLKHQNKSGVYHGNMLGLDPMGYASWDFMKCVDYGSSRRSYYADKYSKYLVVGLFKLACGKIYEERDRVKPVSKAFLRRHGCHSVAAYKGATISGFGRGLYRDEIASPYEEAFQLMYIIVMKL